MTLLDNVLVALGRIQGKRECRKEEDLIVSTDFVVETPYGANKYKLVWHIGNYIDIYNTGLIATQFETHLARINIDSFMTSIVAQAIAICGIVEADLHMKCEEE